MPSWNHDQTNAVSSRRLGPEADYVVINVSSPNTPGLRGLQKKDALRALVRQCQAARDAVQAERWGLSAEEAFGTSRMASGNEGNSSKRVPLFIKVMLTDRSTN